MANPPERPLSAAEVGGCICPRPTSKNEDGEYVWHIDPSCRYHAAAAAQPWNHRIPWNCPTYWDGCNCEGGPFFYG